MRIQLLEPQARLNNKKDIIGYTNQYIIKTIIVELIAGGIIGLAIGYFIDKMFPIFPFFTLLFLIIGCFSSILNIYTTLYIKKI